jgi:hypothetical protein
VADHDNVLTADSVVGNICHLHANFSDKERPAAWPAYQASNQAILIVAWG